LISKPKHQDLELEVEDNVAVFVGAHIDLHVERGIVTLTLGGRDQTIIDALQIDNLPPKDT